jgi:hypothetical protein
MYQRLTSEYKQVSPVTEDTLVESKPSLLSLVFMIEIQALTNVTYMKRRLYSGCPKLW